MTMAHLMPLVIGQVINTALGLFVYLTNRTRRPNKLFMMLCAVIGIWLACQLGGLASTSERAAEGWIRWAFSFSALILPCFDLLLLSILHPDEPIRALFASRRIPIALGLLVAGMIATHFFMSGVQFPLVEAGVRGVAEPDYGPGFAIFNLYFGSYLAGIVWNGWRGRQTVSGVRRVELQFVELGAALSLTTGALLALGLPALTGSSRTAPYSSISVILLNGVIAYGIATHRIMEVPYLLRRLAAYALLCVYLTALYLIVFFLLDRGMGLYGVERHNLVSHVIAALVVAFSLSPAANRLHDVTRRLFVNVQDFDLGETVQQANRLLASISTVDDLTHQFCTLVARSFGTDRVAVYQLEQGRLRLRQSAGNHENPQEFTLDDPAVAVLRDSAEPVVRDILSRLPPTPALTATIRRLGELETAALVGVRTKEGLAGLLLLGPRLSGRIYGSQEQRALRLLGDNLAVSLENARLYTEVQNSKRYTDTLLENLVSGVIATDAGRRITIINREAQRIARLDAARAIGRGPEVLPAPLREAIEVAFQAGEVPRDQEASWRSGESEETTVRMGGVRLRDHTGEPLGVLLVIHDVSAIKKLEAQVRRTDRLASLGTLSAGMAHEIKNPLVTLKTFTQLLPERYDDPDFRNTFSTLLGEEVRRIDSLVNQLLKFARPAKPTLAPLHLHEVAEHTVKLVQQRARQHQVSCETELGAEHDLILGDHDMLVQALLNFLFNAMEAMSSGGSIRLSTRLEEQETPQMGLWGQASTESFIRLSISDTGPGIRPEDLPHVFDPFFTTKSSGTGLGLSVSHGIIHEHHGLIDVESTPMEGTTFHLLFPLAPREAAV